ncbi:abortive infection bacteriophage resistance protein [Fluviicoccus keumensis]|uniref:Abortive infection bacteriophage resistance protein n=1 Tax=Fluviicoccus keumensis TaxID=1435465 RepID=A0A4Q7YPH4_9GAMM|nr:Abi family protein [Fluviicoccus keumensis]RZU38605.1 abortive infection bacteriophage resistance protein [Fluviicoccus keumensis]
MRRFDKPALSVPEQLELLKSRGLTILNEDRARQFLEVVTLFRLSPYMRPFQVPSDSEHHFRPDSTLREIVNIYRFDGAMRHLVMDAIERVEVAMRACISNHMATAYGAHWYLDSANFKTGYAHARLLEDLTRQLNDEQKQFTKEQDRINLSRADATLKAKRIESRKRDNYPRYYGATYDDPALPPSWAMLEMLSLGQLSQLYKGIARDADRKAIARRVELPQDVLESWLHTLTFVRNICAHHARLWNRELAVPPRLPAGQAWIIPKAAGRPAPERRLFVVLSMLIYLMQRVSPESGWRGRLLKELVNVPITLLIAMGFPEKWDDMVLWRD